MSRNMSESDLSQSVVIDFRHILAHKKKTVYETEVLQHIIFILDMKHIYCMKLVS